MTRATQRIDRHRLESMASGRGGNGREHELTSFTEGERRDRERREETG
jgi:hypothetical protein